MAYFANQKLLELAAARNARRECARRAARAAASNVYAVDHVLAPALSLARDEERSFLDTFGEPMPAHLARTLEAEILTWERLEDGIARLREETVTNDVLASYAQRVRSYLSHASDLLRIEEVMVTSCLVRHYEERRDHLLATLAHLDIMKVQ